MSFLSPFPRSPRRQAGPRTKSSLAAGLLLGMSLAGRASPARAEEPAVGEPPVGEMWTGDTNAGPEELKSLSLDTLLKVQVRGASFFALPPEKVPNTSYKLESKAFSRLPVRTLAELLDASIPGLIVGNDRFFGPVLAQRGAVTDTNAKTNAPNFIASSIL